MKKYNRALDCMALAVRQLLKGKPVSASKCLLSAAQSSDAMDALMIIEASNSEAFARAKIEASAKAKLKAKKVTAAEDDGLDALGLGEDEPEEMDEEVEAAMDPEGEPEEVEDEAIEDEDKEIAASLARILTAMVKDSAKPATKAAAKTKK